MLARDIPACSVAGMRSRCQKVEAGLRQRRLLSKHRLEPPMHRRVRSAEPNISFPLPRVIRHAAWEQSRIPSRANNLQSLAKTRRRVLGMRLTKVHPSFAALLPLSGLWFEQKKNQKRGFGLYCQGQEGRKEALAPSSMEPRTSDRKKVILDLACSLQLFWFKWWSFLFSRDRNPALFLGRVAP